MDVESILGRNLNRELPRTVSAFFEPGERALIIIRGIPGSIVATDRRVIVERTATPIRPEIYAYGALTGAHGHLQWIGRRFVALAGPGLKTDLGMYEIGKSRNGTVVHIWNMRKVRLAVDELNALIAAKNHLEGPTTGPHLGSVPAEERPMAEQRPISDGPAWTKSSLRAGLTAERATDVLLLLVGPAAYRALSPTVPGRMPNGSPRPAGRSRISCSMSIRGGARPGSQG